MSAIKLADELRNAIINDCLNSAEEEWYSEIEAMLRKQAKEIEELKQIVEGTIKQAFYEDDYYKLKAEYDLLKVDLEVKKANEK